MVEGPVRFCSVPGCVKKNIKKLAVKMEAVESEILPSEETNPEYRVQVTSKKVVSEQVNKYKELLKTALDGQPEDFPEETKRVLLQELLAVSPSPFSHFGIDCN